MTTDATVSTETTPSDPATEGPESHGLTAPALPADAPALPLGAEEAGQSGQPEAASPAGPPVAHEPDQIDAASQVSRQPPALALPGAGHRSLKLVITLRPALSGDAPAEAAIETGGGPEGPIYHAVLAVGADGCDPLIRPAGAVGLAAVLAEVPALVADAEARWQTDPRYPSTVLPAKAKAAGSRVTEVSRPEQKSTPWKPSAEPATAPAAASAGQPDRQAARVGPDTAANAAVSGAPTTPVTGDEAGAAGAAGTSGKPARAPAPQQLPLFG